MKRMHYFLPIALLSLLPLQLVAEEVDLLSDDFLLQDSGIDSPLADLESKDKGWLDNLVTTLAHEQTRDDKGGTSLYRYSLRLEYEQALATNGFIRLDIKGTHYNSLDEQAKQRAASKGLLYGEAYQHALVKAAWYQYSKGSCVLKAGQQTLIWGEVDGTFTVDDVTPFDFTEPLFTDYASIRLPQLMLVPECFLGKRQRVQLFYTPRAQLHLSSHNDDEYGLEQAAGIDDEDLDAEWGARYRFTIGKTEYALMFADLIANAPSQVLASATPPAPGSPIPLLPALSDYHLYGVSFNYASGAWQFKGDLAFKTDQLVDGTLSETSDRVELALGLEFLSVSNHSFNAGIWGTHDLDDELVPGQNDSTPFVTVSWNKSYLNDDLDLSILANGRERPRSLTATTQASYQYNDYWNLSAAITLADVDQNSVNPLQSSNDEINLGIKYQF